MVGNAGATSPAQIAGAVMSVITVSLFCIVLMISVAAMIFSGPSLGAFLGQGIGLSLFGGVVLGIVGAFVTSFRGSISHPQDVTGVILALSGTAVAARLAGEPSETLYATMAVLIALASVATGLAFLMAGAFRLGVLARFIPYPVMGGFLAGAGYLMVAGAVRMVSGQTTSLADLARPEAAWRWGPVLLLGATMLWLVRRTGKVIVLPAILALAFAGFYLWLVLSGLDLEEAGRRGLLLGPFEARQELWGAFRPGLLREADYPAILSQLPALATLVGLAFVGAMLNASAIELATGQPADLNRDLRGLGTANLLAGLGGGITGYHVLGGTLLANRLTGLNSRWIGVGVGLTAATMLTVGASVLSVLPIGVFAALLAFLGLDLLVQWLWIERQRLQTPDVLLVLAILAIAVTVGFLEAIVAGTLAASALFILSYSRLDVVRGRTTGQLRLSTTERSEASVGMLMTRGAETLILELHGYVFFGTAHALVADCEREIAAQDAAIRNVIVDFRRVQGLDASAVFNLGKLEQICRAHGARLIFTELPPQLRRQVELAGLTRAVLIRPSLDDALSMIEEEVLSEGGDLGHTKADSGFRLLFERAGALGASHFKPEQVAAGAEVLRQGDPSDCAILLEDGRLSATVSASDGRSTRVATFLPGAMVGEIGLYAQTVRTATVTAETDSTIRRIDSQTLSRLSELDPALARDFHAMIARLLARRLGRATALLHEVSR
jgi:SulP family sulfate permease